MNNIQNIPEATSFDGIVQRVDQTPLVPSMVGTGQQSSLIAEAWRIVKNRRFTILGSMLLVLLLGLTYSLLSVRQYTARSTVEIARNSAKILNVDGLRSDVSNGDQEFYQTQYGLLRSRSLAERVVRTMKLARDPAFRAAFNLDEAQTENRARPLASDELRTLRELLLRSVSIAPVRQSQLVDISFTTPDPALSAKLADAWAKAFIEQNIERSFGETAFARSYLQRELGATRAKLEAAERQLVDYASSNRIFSIETSGPNGETTARRSLVEDDVAALNAELNRARAARVIAQSAFENRAGGGNGAQTAATTTAGPLRDKLAEVQADYQKILVQFEPGYPAARELAQQIERLSAEIAKRESRLRDAVTVDLRSEYLSARQRELALVNQLAVRTSTLLAQKRQQIQYNIFQREVDSTRELYNGLLQRFKEIGAASGISSTNISIVDPADIPQYPSSPRIALNLLISLILGGLLGLGLTVIMEQVDVALNNPLDVERTLGQPLLGVVPVIDGFDEPQSVRILLENRKSAVVEAYLAFRTTLSFSSAHGVPGVLAVSSTRPGEGKSTTAFALASLIAASGKRTLLIDCDMRSPSVHGYLGVSNIAGLSNALTGQDDLGLLIAPVAESGLSVMLAGPQPPNAAELLASDRLGWVLQRLRTDYDHIVLDAPPVIGLADSLIVSSLADGLIYVVEAHRTRVGEAVAALHRLRSTNTRVLGVLLTKFQSDRSAFNYDYGYEYGYGYGRDDDRKSLA